VYTDPRTAWAVILAGGDGTRLKSLTRLISGDARPKQFCPILGGRTLLGETRERLGRVIPPERTLFVVQDAHRDFYKDELADVDPRFILTQPSNKGTAVAIAYAISTILEFDENAVVAFFPADHFYEDDEPFLAGVARALDMAGANQDSLMLLGAQPYSPEVEYGWIEPASEADELARVSRFWEKPSLEHAEDLLARGCLWNTFVMIGPARTFCDLLQAAAPALAGTMQSIVRSGGLSGRRARRLFASLAPVDFSYQVLSLSTDRLLVFRLSGVRWSDLGKPERVIETLQKAGIKPQWATSLSGAISGLANKATA